MPSIRALFSILALAFAQSAVAQSTWPARPVRLIVPLAAGGTVDIIARAVAAPLAERLGQPVIVENRPSASSLVGTQFVARSAPDGYTLIAIANTFVSAPAIVLQPGYDPVKDFTGVAETCRLPQVVVTPASSAVRSMKELAEAARARPGGISYASAGAGATAHFATEMFNAMVGVRMLHVPYKGSAPAIADMLGGQVDLMFDQIPTSIAHIRSGKLRALAVTTRTRSAVLPDIPTIEEAGFAGYEYATFNGILAPAGTPREIVDRLHREISQITAQPALREKYLSQGIEVGSGRTPEAFTTYLREQVEDSVRIARAAGMKPE